MGKWEVYFNLHKRCYSLRQSGRVVAHLPSVCLLNCTFVVQPAGQRRVRETGVKNVHAFVKGIGRGFDEEYYFSDDPVRVRYNPHTHDTFVAERAGMEIGVHSAGMVLCKLSPQATPILWAWRINGD